MKKDLKDVGRGVFEGEVLSYYGSYLGQFENTPNVNTKKYNYPQRMASISSREQFDENRGSNMVILNVYDLDSLSRKINKFTRAFDIGAFHAGVEVYGIEYCFGSTNDGTTGITSNLPRRHPIHIYRESIKMGRTNFTRGEVKRIISNMKPMWPGSEYNIFRRNCLTFAEELCTTLNVGEIPSFVKLLPELLCQAGDGLDRAAQHLVTIFHRVTATCSNLTAFETEKSDERNYSIDNRQVTESTVGTMSDLRNTI
ncbi:hypothetical protein FG379_003118 [Cryptosporidium bovis]|uniref:uncharacterized protein n=1 Tax=Cryptosporidium bovis TaxID=310047 RepID=UPI00351A000C|nr:hypothetical protein FG379_003118 [Cryptosporidium bovis]